MFSSIVRQRSIRSSQRIIKRYSNKVNETAKNGIKNETAVAEEPLGIRDRIMTKSNRTVFAKITVVVACVSAIGRYYYKQNEHDANISSLIEEEQRLDTTINDLKSKILESNDESKINAMQNIFIEKQILVDQEETEEEEIYEQNENEKQKKSDGLTPI